MPCVATVTTPDAVTTLAIRATVTAPLVIIAVGPKHRILSSASDVEEHLEKRAKKKGARECDRTKSVVFVAEGILLPTTRNRS